ncbi:DUF805 domain-containing protein [Streptomyces europaeiscabiei]|uniref:DUF805 domain-containing protein n=1 Tax=Streptomyces europaeiscabiei TaxID=146819 RepID=UPI00062855AD|nr:DUF805 domain-containing protein [Streptomyces europaeiscabiei]MDX2530711.1 DUF805 domain-containing protein [Streptomyces europaeiscabiei]MDX2766279.1 DUF805 domain-containing protein [Streptomyces europaeiscabiei]MDX2775440.1 DUF805 domain-containing protein [Streptomyces europaeiscabiei]MDX3671581.1 DUF805 domain-containing protein [Streptomyces europaeiscabiei]MDX3715186.1 DUF805 domain-containing protein [Streptomyces europaeiscabiei]
MNWFVEVLRKYVVFSGRARRQEYWMFTLIASLIYLGLVVLGLVMDTEVPELVFVAAVFLPSLAVSVRRLHDIGRSGWWVLIGIVPCVGTIVTIIFMATEGQRDANRYGPDPKAYPAHL